MKILKKMFNTLITLISIPLYMIGGILMLVILLMEMLKFGGIIKETITSIDLVSYLDKKSIKKNEI